MLFLELMDSEPDPPVIQWLDRQSWTSLWTTSITILEIRYGLIIMARRPPTSPARGGI